MTAVILKYMCASCSKLSSNISTMSTGILELDGSSENVTHVRVKQVFLKKKGNFKRLSIYTNAFTILFIFTRAHRVMSYRI